VLLNKIEVSIYVDDVKIREEKKVPVMIIKQTTVKAKVGQCHE
jgi:hypothetical protein